MSAPHVSGLLGNGNSLSVDCFQDGISAPLEQGLADGFSQFNRIATVAGLAQNLGAIGIGYDCLKVQTTVANFSECTDGYLAASAKFVE